MKQNLITALGGQIYVAFLGIVVLPYYLHLMGPEGYGLIGFFTMLQASLTFLDLGFTSTLVRETTRFKEGVVEVQNYCRIHCAIEILFMGLACVLLASFLWGSSYIAREWLHTKTLPLADVQFSIQNMAFCLALRWMGSVYRAVLTGHERFLWLSGFNAFITTLRFIGVLPVMAWWGSTPNVFFFYQTLIALVEMMGCYAKAKKMMPASKGQGRHRLRHYGLRESFKSLNNVLAFSLSVAFTTVIWGFVTQVDKCLLSTSLPLSDYGYFSTAVLIANGLFLITSALTAVMVPRLTAFIARGEQQNLMDTYRITTRWVTAALSATVCMCIIGGKAFLWAWMGDQQVIERSASILTLYIAGNSLFVLTAFPYYLQCAKGDLLLHVIGHIALLVLFTPFCFLGIKYYGSQGAGYVWLMTAAIYFFIWGPVIHRRLSPGLHAKWVLNDIGIAVVLSTFAAAIYINIPYTGSRLGSLFWSIGGWAVCFIAASVRFLPSIRSLRICSVDFTRSQPPSIEHGVSQ